MSHNILIVEDDLISAAYLKKLCKEHAFTVVDITSNAKDTIKAMKSNTIELVLMDIMIDGGISGCELAMQIRGFNKEVIIIFLTAYTSEEMVSYALNAKAYSYLLKPYRDVEIISTIKMALRNNMHLSHKEHSEYIECKNGFKLYKKTGKIFHHSEELYINEKYHLILKLLIKNKSNCVSYEQLYRITNEKIINLNTLRSTIHRLKTKLPELELHAVSKVGYVLY